MSGFTTDGGFDPGVYDYISAQAAKSEVEQIAFNEGLVCAGFALGSFIDQLPHGDQARGVLERAYKAVLGLRPKVRAP